MNPVQLWESLLADLIALIPKPLRPRADVAGWAQRLDACVRASAEAAHRDEHRAHAGEHVGGAA